ncbi:MAG: BadF/BadG/BcrA/BcrD ATPase family protein [Candidatus Bipolaricaulota bacterium]
MSPIAESPPKRHNVAEFQEAFNLEQFSLKSRLGADRELIHDIILAKKSFNRKLREVGARNLRIIKGVSSLDGRTTSPEARGSLAAGIDGGGTKTTIAVAQTNGALVGIKRIGPTRLGLISATEAANRLGEGFAEILGPNWLSEIGYACFGFGGLETGKSKDKAISIAETVLSGQDNYLVTGDGTIGLHCGTFGRPGLSIIAGTGTLLVAEDPHGQKGRVDGWGHLFGDLGSAYYIGRQVVKTVLEAFDGRGDSTILKNMLLENLGLEEVPALVDHFYNKERTPTAIAELAPLAHSAALKGDAVAECILEDASKEVLHSATTLIRRLNMGKLDPLRVVLIGGVFTSDLVRKKVRGELENSFENIKIIRPSWEPVTGAIYLALRNMGLEITKSVETRLQEDFNLQEPRN